MTTAPGKEEKTVERLTIQRCEEMAKATATPDKCTFDIAGPRGRVGARWLDPYYGLLIIDGESGFTRATEIDDAGLWCENFKAGGQ